MPHSPRRCSVGRSVWWLACGVRSPDETPLDWPDVGADRLLAARPAPPSPPCRLSRLERRRPGSVARRGLYRARMGGGGVRDDRPRELLRLPAGASAGVARGRPDAEARVAVEHVPPRADPRPRARPRGPARRRAEPSLEDVLA